MSCLALLNNNPKWCNVLQLLSTYILQNFFLLISFNLFIKLFSIQLRFAHKARFNERHGVMINRFLYFRLKAFSAFKTEQELLTVKMDKKFCNDLKQRGFQVPRQTNYWIFNSIRERLQIMSSFRGVWKFQKNSVVGFCQIDDKFLCNLGSVRIVSHDFLAFLDPPFLNRDVLLQRYLGYIKIYHRFDKIFHWEAAKFAVTQSSR